MAMASNVVAAGGADEPRDERPSQRPPESRPAAPRGPGFFTIYKKNQGYWTRMGTAIAAANRAVKLARDTTIGICAGVLIGYGLLVFWLRNKPANADFLIATDSEMKKVNWTSRKELMGSTKVVIIFMFLIAVMLFAFDIFFGYLFYYMRVLQTKPF